jgi:large subunit ribosomal protein L10
VTIPPGSRVALCGAVAGSRAEPRLEGSGSAFSFVNRAELAVYGQSDIRAGGHRAVLESAGVRPDASKSEHSNTEVDEEVIRNMANMRTKGPRADKVAVVGTQKEMLSGATAAYLTNYRSLTVTEITTLRRKLRAVGGDYHVVKNTLFRRAAGDKLTPELDKLLEGPTAIAFAQGDPVAVAKALTDFLRDLRKPDVTVKGGYLDGKTLSPAQVTALAKLPPREVILGQTLGTIQAPLTNFAGTMQGVLSEFARTLQALADQKQAEAA